MQKLVDQIDTKIAVANSGGAVAPLVATKVDATGYGRARFVFNFGSGAATTAALSAGIGIWAAATSGGTYTAIAGASLAAVSSGLISGTNLVMAIDVPITNGSPWLQVSGGSMLSTSINNSATVDLYRQVYRPDIEGYQQVISV